jgi:ribosome assembly protein YihI (activator of Der GTPase)
MNINNYKATIVILIVCMYTPISIAQNNTSINYTTYINTVIANNFMAQKANNEATYGALQLKAAQGGFDPSFNFKYDNKFYNNQNYYSVLSTEIKQQLYTNQYLKAGYTYGIGNNINPEDITYTKGQPYLGVELGLLQGLSIDKKRAEVLKAKEYTNYYNAEKNIQLNNLLIESLTRYMDWLYAKDLLLVNQQFMQASEQRLQGIIKLAQAGEKAAIDTIEANLLVQARKLEVQSNSIEIQKTSNDVAFYLNNSSAISNNSITTIDNLETYYNKAQLAFNNYYRLETAVNPILVKYNALSKVLDVNVKLQRELIKPMLTVSYNFLGTGNNQNSVQLSSNNNNYKWGVQFSVPLFVRAATNEYKKTQLLAKNNTLELQNKNNELNNKLTTNKQSGSILLNQINNTTTLSYSKQLFVSEQQKIENGESSLFMLNTRENKLLETEVKLLEYKLKFIKTMLYITYINGNLNYEF